VAPVEGLTVLSVLRALVGFEPELSL
jgi:hypothetical protein